MATTISTQDIVDAKRDIDDIGKAVNENVIVSPRYGEDFKSLPMIAAEFQDAINTIVIDSGVPAVAVSDASGKNQQEINNELYVYKKPVIYALNLKTDGTDQISELNALAVEAASKRLELVLPKGTITINDEFIPPSNLKISSICAVSSVSSGGSGTVLKWGGVSGTGKAVLRCSTAAIGVTPTSAMVGVEINGIEVDAAGCDYGAYFRYFTNESRVKNLLVRNAKKCNIWGGQLWFCWFDQLTSIGAYDKGVVFGIAQSGETGDLAVNGINFPYIRIHTSGRDNTYDHDTNIRGGCGLLVNTQGCNYGLVQSEANWGIGLIDNSGSRTNTWSTLYLENNARTSPDTLKISYLVQSGNPVRNITLGSVTLANKQLIVNDNTASPIYIDQLVPVDQSYQCLQGGTNSAGFVIRGDSRPALAGMPADEQSRLIKYNISMLAEKLDVDLRYTSSLGTLTLQRLFRTTTVHVFLVPRNTVAGTHDFAMNLAGTGFHVSLVDPTAGVPVRVRTTSLTAGTHTLTQTTPATSEVRVDVIVVYGTLLGNGRFANFVSL